MNANAVRSIETIAPAFTPPTLQPWTASTLSLSAQSGTG
ncbi:MAG: hypothetical protein RIS60_2373 [Pseudomonadota bacterium]